MNLPGIHQLSCNPPTDILNMRYSSVNCAFQLVDTDSNAK